MYFPYLRGRQYELIALRELIQNKKLSNSVIPIIEPVKASPTLLLTIEEFIKNRKKLCIIMNPLVGDFNKEIVKIGEDSKTKFINFLKNDLIIPCYLIDKNSAFNIDSLQNKDKIAICKSVNDIELLLPRENDFLYKLIPSSNSAKRRIKGRKIELDDKFRKKDRNSDYALKDDEFFSEDHLYFNEDGFDGFSDFSIVGDDYIESGFAPFAVAIHIVYFGEEKTLNVHHFVSNTNDDIRDPQGKFGEALSKLVSFEELKEAKNHSLALDKFNELYNNKQYPGLGSVKKLSIMHHLELISRFLDGKD